MKQILFCVMAAVVFAVGAVCALNKEKKTDVKFDVLRIHIRANSNDDVDQNVKFKVKDAIVRQLKPLLADVSSKQQAISVINRNLSVVTKTANAELAKNGFGYASRAEIREEEFPTRVYDDIVFESGVYTALIVELGSGEGNNWWCVMYPPLCFINAQDMGTSEIEYQSIIKEWLSNLK